MRPEAKSDDSNVDSNADSNVDSIEALYRRYGALVLRRARTLLVDEQAAEDALQEVFLRVVSHHERFRRESSPVTWLYRITTNHCLNVLRDGARRGRKLREQAGRAQPEGSPATAATIVAGAEARLSAGQILSRLPPELCEIAVYHHVDRMNHEEIGKLLGVSRRTIGNRLKELKCLAQSLVGTTSTLETTT